MRSCEKIATGIVILLLILSGCSNKNDTSAEEKAVISIDDRVLTLAEFNEYFETTKISSDEAQSQDSATIREARLSFLLQLVEEMIILRRADDLHIHISTRELDEAVRNIKTGYSEADFEYLFLKQAISFEAWQERLKKRLLVQKVIRKELWGEASVTPQKINDYYDKHWQEWSYGEQVRALQILLSTKDQAKQILKQLKNGDDFATLARSHSQAPEAKKGGDLGYLVRGQLPESLEKPLFALKKGAVSPVVKTSYGFHIFKVIEKRKTSKPKIEEYIERIKQAIQKERVDAAYGPWLAKLRSKYRIEINEDLI